MLYGCGVEHTGRLGGVQDGRREGSLHGEHGAPMERVPWITASIKGLTVTGLKAGLGVDERAAGGRREYNRKRASPRLDGLDGRDSRRRGRACERRVRLAFAAACACLYSSISALVNWSGRREYHGRRNRLAAILREELEGEVFLALVLSCVLCRRCCTSGMWSATACCCGGGGWSRDRLDLVRREQGREDRRTGGG